uniref:Uncharacterized protein n=1 Tax=Acrobeloides nanus TaxID=290746 RepID=A0A914C1M3_9BILA
MLRLNPRERINLSQALEHPFVKQWWEKNEVLAPISQTYDESVENEDLTIDEWK